MTLHTSSQGIAFIQSFESCRLSRYLDSAGLPTIGWGHRIQPDESYAIIPQEQADALFLQDLSVIESAVNQAIDIILAQHEFDACASLAYNIGPGNFARSTLVKLLNSGNTSLASQQFLRWDLEDGNPSSGLYARRVAEKAIFDTGTYTNHV